MIEDKNTCFGYSEKKKENAVKNTKVTYLISFLLFEKNRIHCISNLNLKKKTAEIPSDYILLIGRRKTYSLNL